MAIVPIGSFEQHGYHLPYITDTLIATTIAEHMSTIIRADILPPVTITCSHEHKGLGANFSISSTTLWSIVSNITDSCISEGYDLVVLLNCHGGNYVLSNFAQERNYDSPIVLLAPGKHNWQSAVKKAKIESELSEDMHGGEIETSIMMWRHPDLVRKEHISDHTCGSRPLLTTLGIQEYTESGIIGKPSLASPIKGEMLVSALCESIADDIKRLRGVASLKKWNCLPIN